jgi:Spy/CpxP family protein refolding chaperone
MKRWWVWVLLLLSLGVNVGILATLGAQRLRRPGPPAAEAPPAPAPAAPEPAAPSPEPPRATVPAPTFQGLADRLGLEGEARRRFLDIQRRAFETMRAERQRMLAARAALRRELTAAAPDRARIDSLLAEAGAAQAALERSLVSSLLESRALLDPEQQRLYLRFVEERLRPAGAPRGPRRPLRERLLDRRGARP